MPTLTNNFEFQKPLVNNATDADLWGGQLNTNWDDADSYIALTTSSKTNDFNVATSEFNYTYLIDASSNTVTATLPAASNVFNGFTVRFKGVDASNAITIDANGSETIDGNATVSVGSGDVVEIVCDGTNWIRKTSSGTPSGTVIDYAGTSAPSGWLNCDGSAVSRTEYASLFAAIGTTWGTGDGSTTFNIPDLVTNNRFRRASGGSLSVGDTQDDELKSHTHTGDVVSLTAGSNTANPNWGTFSQYAEQGSIDATGGTETRPYSAVFLSIIKT